MGEWIGFFAERFDENQFCSERQERYGPLFVGRVTTMFREFSPEPNREIPPRCEKRKRNPIKLWNRKHPCPRCGQALLGEDPGGTILAWDRPGGGFLSYDGAVQPYGHGAQPDG